MVPFPFVEEIDESRQGRCFPRARCTAYNNQPLMNIGYVLQVFGQPNGREGWDLVLNDTEHSPWAKPLLKDIDPIASNTLHLIAEVSLEFPIVDFTLLRGQDVVD